MIDGKAVASDGVDGNPVSGEAATGDTIASKTGTDDTGDGSAVSGADFTDIICFGGGRGIAGDGGSVGEVTVLVVGAVLRASTLAVCTTSIWYFSIFFAFLLPAVWGQ